MHTYSDLNNLVHKNTSSFKIIYSSQMKSRQFIICDHRQGLYSYDTPPTFTVVHQILTY